MEEETCLHHASHCTVFLLFMAFTTVLQIMRRGLDLWAKQETKAHLHLSARSQQNAPSSGDVSTEGGCVGDSDFSSRRNLLPLTYCSESCSTPGMSG